MVVLTASELDDNVGVVLLSFLGSDFKVVFVFNVSVAVTLSVEVVFLLLREKRFRNNDFCDSCDDIADVLC
jgi:hypothetical protein